MLLDGRADPCSELFGSKDTAYTMTTCFWDKLLQLYEHDEGKLSVTPEETGSKKKKQLSVPLTRNICSQSSKSPICIVYLFGGSNATIDT